MRCRVSESIVDDWAELFRAVVIHDDPILPKPLWGQGAAYVAFVIDSLRERLKKTEPVYEALAAALVTSLKGWSNDI